MGETLFVSDIHLDAKRPAIVELFNSFLTRRAIHADSLYILGDLFEYWIGDDVPYAEYSATFDALKQLTEKNVPVFFLHGNRDFLIAHRFTQKTGVALLPEEQVISINDQRILLMHGDTLCTDDIAYQNFRNKTHNKLLQWLVLHLPVRLRQSLANYLRNTSKQAIEQKSVEIMDVNQTAVVAAMQRNDVMTLIHGHTHRPAIHEFTLDTSNCTRVVLGDWYKHGNVLRITEQDMRLEDFSSVK